MGIGQYRAHPMKRDQPIGLLNYIKYWVNDEFAANFQTRIFPNRIFPTRSNSPEEFLAERFFSRKIFQPPINSPPLYKVPLSREL